jgi:hypothetical protein
VARLRYDQESLSADARLNKAGFEKASSNAAAGLSICAEVLADLDSVLRT